MKSTYQFCGFWDTYCSIDVAAWLQALGSLIALGVTIGLYIHANQKNESNRRKSQMQMIRQLTKHSSVLLEQCLNAYNITAFTMRSDELKQTAPLIGSLLQWSKAIETDTLNKIEFEAFVDLQTSLQSIIMWIQKSNDLALHGGLATILHMKGNAELFMGKLKDKNERPNKGWHR